MEADGKNMQKHFWTSISAQNPNLLLPCRLFPYVLTSVNADMGYWLEDCPKKQIITKEQTGTGHHVS